MAIYGMLGKSEFVSTPFEKDGMIRAFEDKERPTHEHVMNADGLWVLPKITNQDINLEREKRYKAETDELMIKIASHKLLGKDVSAMEQEAKTKLMKIREELPYVSNTTTHYEPLLEPTPPVVDEGVVNAGETIPE